jgi:predicted NAD/FAD-binding protein
MGGAIWSCTLEAMLEFPAQSFVDFFEAHGLLTVTRQPQWYTVTGGSQEYVKRLTKSFEDKIRTSCAAVAVTRSGGKVTVEDAKGERKTYDHVIFASHADESLALLKDASPEEQKVLGAFKYQKNLAVLHKDVSIMPKRRRCWASWVYHAPKTGTKSAALAVTYWMNQLQSIDNTTPVFVTLNPEHAIAPEYVFDTHLFDHPVYSLEAVHAQKQLPALQGKHNTWFCGAYHSNGFHEDGFKSAVTVANLLGVKVPWQ